MDFEFSPKVKELQARLTDFMDENAKLLFNVKISIKKNIYLKYILII